MPQVTRRLLVSPSGMVHQPNCHHVPAAAEIRGWGQIDNLDAMLAAI